jgi:hypothetical protein
MRFRFRFRLPTAACPDHVPSWWRHCIPPSGPDHFTSGGNEYPHPNPHPEEEKKKSTSPIRITPGIWALSITTTRISQHQGHGASDPASTEEIECCVKHGQERRVMYRKTYYRDVLKGRGQ